MVAMDVLLTLHVPPASPLPNVVDAPTHVWKVPVINDGNGSTVTIVDDKQPVGNVYTILANPLFSPVTTPSGLTEAISGELLLQLPPGVKLNKVVVWPIHTSALPVMATGSGLTVRTAVARQPVANV